MTPFLRCSAWLLAIGAASAQTVLVKPYVQPGPESGLDCPGSAWICWLTDQTPGAFTVEYQLPGQPLRRVVPQRTALDFAKAPPPKPVEKAVAKAVEKAAVAIGAIEAKPKIPPLPEREQHYFKYAARLTDLPCGAEVHYRVALDAATVRAAAFRTRAAAGQPTRFCLVGDLANGQSAQKAIAARIALERPEFLVALGDIVYPSGRVLQYSGYYWDTYCNGEAAGPKTGAPLMATIPFYAVLGNHDLAAKLPTIPDALGAYYFFHVPANGPPAGPWSAPLGADAAVAAKFKAAAGASYPSLGCYSFDAGPVHFTVVDNNKSTQMDDPALRRWVERDLANATAPWKILCCHVPPFQSSKQHYTEQQLRKWHPMLEAAGVDLVFAGHVHNYQRTKPLRFAPAAGAADKRGRVDGTFGIDTSFDGKAQRTPAGIIHIVAGGGGAPLYGPGLEKTAAQLRKDHGANYADFTAAFDSGRHSFVMAEATATRFLLRALGPAGEEIDRIEIDQPAETSR